MLTTTNCLSIFEPDHLDCAADLIAAGELVGIFFNGAYVFFGDIDRVSAAERIFEIKKRPIEKNLGMCCAPQHIDEYVDLTNPFFNHYPLSTIQKLYREVHALALILPASANTPDYLIRNGTILIVWTEFSPYYPLYHLMDKLRERGVRGILGASANMSGEPTYHTLEQMLSTFEGKIPLILTGVNDLPAYRKKSTTIVDLTTQHPYLLREGSVPEDEIREHLTRLGLGELRISENAIRIPTVLPAPLQ